MVGFTVIGIKLPDVTSVSRTVYMSADCVHVNTLTARLKTRRCIIIILSFNGALLMDSLLVEDKVHLVYFVSSTIVLLSCAV